MRKIILLCSAALCTIFSYAQVTGIKTIGVDYPTMAAAVTALNTTGVGAGGATINVPAGYTETVPSGGLVLGTTLLNASLSAANPLLFQKSGSGANPLLTAFTGGSSTTSDGVFKLLGTDYVTIDGISIKENAANTAAAFMEWGYALVNLNAAAPFDGCQNVTIKNCSVTLDRTNPNGSFGIYSGHNIATNATALTITATGDLHSNNKFYSNTISNINQGIWISGFAAASPYTLYDQNNDVGGLSAATGNNVTNGGGNATFNFFGVYMANQNGGNASYNTINNASGGVGNNTNTYGIYFFGTNASANATFNNVTLTQATGAFSIYGVYPGNTGTTVVTNNTIQEVTTAATTSTYYHIYLPNTAVAETVSNNVFANSNINTTGTVYLIYASNSTPTVTVSNNAISGTFAKTAAGGTVYGYYNFGSPGSGTATISGNNFSNITVSGATTFYGIYQATSTSQIEKIQNNTISNVAGGTSTLFGIYHNYGAAASEVSGNTVSNIAGAGTVDGIQVGASVASLGLNVFSNTVFTLSTTGASTVSGVLHTNGVASNVYKNKVYDLLANNASGVVNGIAVTGGTTVSVYNNLIGDLRTPIANAANPLIGLNITGGTTVNAYFNTININGTSTGALFGSSAVSVSTTPAVTLRNNIFVNTSTPVGATGFTTAYRRSSTTLTTYATASNNNLFYAGTPGAGNLIYYDGTNSYQTLAAYKAMTVPGTLAPRDNVSVSENPTFLSVVGSNASFLHISTAVATQIESAGATIAGVTDDFDGDVRNVSTPDIGADEGNFISLDLTGPGINYTPLTSTLCITARTISATISDASGVNVIAGTKPRIWFKKLSNANALPATNTNTTDGWKYAEATNSVNPFSLTIDPSVIFGGVAGGDVIQYFIVAQDNAGTPNISINAGTFAAAPSSVALTAAAFPIGGTVNSYAQPLGISGTVTVGPSGTYPSLTGPGGLFATLNSGGLTGNLVATIVDPAITETGANALNAFTPACTGPYSLTIKPASGVTTTLTGSANAIIKLNGVSNVTIDGSNNGTNSQNMTIINNQATTSAVIWNASLGGAGNGANNNTFKNLVLVGGSGSVSTVIGIANAATGSVTTAGDDNNNLTIQNCSISKVLIGIEAIGTTALPQNGLTISGNSIGTNTAANYIQYLGIQLNNAVSPVITQNTIFNIKTTTLTSATTGIDVGAGVNGGQITRNNINGIYNQNTGQWSSYGINFSSGTGTTNVTVANNFISDIQTVIYTSSTTFNAFGIRLTGGTNLKIYNNSVNLFGNITLASGTGFSADLLVTSSAVTGLDLRNNIFVNTMTFAATASVYNVYLPSGFAFGTSNYNDYSGTSGAGPTTYYVGYNGTANQSTLANWQTAFSQDAQSQSVAPVFVSSTDLHLSNATVGTNWCLNSAGVAIAGITNDIDGDTRNTPPDLGADEFNPLGDAAATPASQTVCSGTAITAISYTGTGTTFTWTRDNTVAVTGIAASGSGNITGTLTNTTTAAVTVTFTVTAYNASGCAGATFTATVLVNPTPAAIATPASQTVCSTSPITTISLSSATTGTTYTWTRDNTATVTGMASSGSGNITGSLTNTTAAPVTVTFTITPSANGCAGLPITAAITVNVGATITPTLTQPTTCATTDGAISIALSGVAGPYTFAWTGPGVNPTAQNQTGLIVGTYNVTVTSGNGCTSSAVFSLTGPGGCAVCPVVGSVTTNPASSGCSGSAITFTASGLTSMGVTYGITFKSFTAVPADPYTGGTVLATVANGSLTGGGTTATGTGSFATANTYYVYAVLSPTPADPTCRPSAVTNFVVNQTPTATATPASQTICSGSAITTIVAAGSAVPGTVYNWTRNNTTTVTGIAGSGTGNISGALTNTTAAPVTVTFTVTPSANGCTGAPVTATVIVNPATTAVATPAAQTICSGATIVPIALTGVAGTTFTWTRNNTATVPGGIPASGSGSTISGFMINTTNAPVTVTFTITPTANGCGGTPITATVLVNPLASAVATPATQTACSGSAITTIALTSNVTGATYAWTRDNTATVTGIAASGTGNITGTLVNAGITPVTVTFTITPSFGGCAGVPIIATVTVNPTPVVTQPANQTLCNGSTTAAITFASTLTGTTYAWTNSTPSIGLAASGTGNIAAFTATNAGATAVTATITVTPAVNGCTGIPKTFTITVNPTATVAAVSSQTLCAGGTTTAITFTGAVAGTTYSWTNNTPSIGLAASGTGNIAAFTAVNNTSAAVTATITVTPTAAGCAGASQTFTITVNGLSVAPTGATASSTTLCGPGTVNLSVQGGALGTGASWKWYTGTCGGTLIGTGATLSGIAANGTVTYYVRAEGTCNTTTCASVTVTVNGQPTISLSAAPYTSLLPNLTTGITATITPVAASNTIVWYRDGNVVTGATTNVLSNISVDQLGSYTARVTTAAGCTALSAPVVITASSSDKLYILPNPNNGQFKLRYYTSVSNVGSLRTVTIYDGKGANVYSKRVTTTAPYSTIDVNITNAGKGIFLVVIGDTYGREMITGKVVVE